MKNILFLLLFSFMVIPSCFAQTESVSNSGDLIIPKRMTHNFNLSIGVGSSYQIVSPSYFHTWKVGKRRALQLSYGIRHSHYFGKDVTHRSAPPEFYGDEALEDSVFVGDPKMGNITLFIGASYLIKNRVELGFNIDAIGYTFGGDRDAIFTSSGVETPVTVSPNSITALLVGANDIGMLKVEIFAGYKFNSRWTARIGVNNLFTEYRTPTELQAGNTRFRAEGTAFMVSGTYTPGW